MPETVQDREADNGIILGLLKSVEQDGGRSQRRLAAELGIALGLVNAYLKRCVSKGLVKVQNVPARRYAYYLTPKGFAEKSRLTVNYLTSSLIFPGGQGRLLSLVRGGQITGLQIRRAGGALRSCRDRSDLRYGMPDRDRGAR